MKSNIKRNGYINLVNIYKAVLYRMRKQRVRSIWSGMEICSRCCIVKANITYTEKNINIFKYICICKDYNLRNINKQICGCLWGRGRGTILRDK